MKRRIFERSAATEIVFMEKEVQKDVKKII